MAKKCPPGVICIENISFIFLISFITLATILVTNLKNDKGGSAPPTIVIDKGRPTYDITQRRSVLFNPYMPPLQDNTFYSPGWGIPINTPTSYYDTHYRQVGLLTRLSGEENYVTFNGETIACQ